MSQLVDIVNFNADASCLDSAKWLAILKGESNSLFCQWLLLYVRYGKRMALGMTGATVSDLIMQNPDAVTIVLDNPDIFQVILRPYSHDISLLRTSYGFRFNLAAGKAAIQGTFDRVSNYFLPPEFMLMSEQVTALAMTGVKGTFINSEQYTSDLSARIPKRPYLVRGVMGAKVGCIPIDGELTQFYLRTIQLWDATEWNKVIQQKEDSPLRLWRDGESPFLIPNGIEREEFWLTNCTADRVHLKDEEYDTLVDSSFYHSYPVHSFSDWMKEFRMLGYLGRIQEIEKRLPNLPAVARYFWLLTINSDILSAVEKHSPLVRLRLSPMNEQIQEFRILRCERSYEGEEYLAFLDRYILDEKDPPELNDPITPHLIKAKGRIEHLKRLEPLWSDVMRYS